MSELTTEQKVTLLWIPIGGLLLYFLVKEDSTGQSITEARSVVKESEFLNYNKDSIFIDLLHSEDHLRNLVDKDVSVKQGEASCVIKHLADAEGHADEAISHSADLNRAGILAQGTPEEFKIVRDQLHDLRGKFSEGGYTPKQAISKLRDVRRQFESFNPTFDISHCKACSVGE